MKFLYSLILLVFLCSCGSSTTSTENEPEQPESAYPHAYFYAQAQQPVSFSDISALAYESSSATFSYGVNTQQFVEYWSPTDHEANNERPAIIFIHGGCWSNTYRIDQSYPLATALSLNGFHVWSVEYRATGDQGGGWPGTYQDIEQALEFIFSAGENYYGKRNIMVLGHSAGGHLALLARSNLENEFNTVGLAAITDIVSYADTSGGCNSLAIRFMNGLPADKPEEYALANPQLSQLADDAFLFIGDIDPIVDTSQASQSGLPFEIVEGTGHFDWIHPGTESFEILLRYLHSDN
jgi:acetyl esterase/lipase